jgi:phosphatidylserine/phosphatidylglycerophosphate/cardiolipin synthase-like enzyme
MIVACNGTLPFSLPPALPDADPGGDNGWYEIYFTNPSCAPEEVRHGGVDEIIAADLQAAKESVDIAAYDLDATAIVDALIALDDRDIPVRIVTDESNEDLLSIRRLRRGGLTVVTDDRSALMHDKFIVIDRQIVWTGSLNYTSNGAYCNNNNAVRFDLPLLARNFTAEMDEMYDEHRFGPTSPDQTPYEQMNVSTGRLENYFAPEKEVAPIIAATVATAQEEILFMAFSFTDEQIGDAMLQRAAAGVTVNGVFEAADAEAGFSTYPTMRASALATVAVRLDGNPRLMHHKVIIVDRETVVFGSFNFTASANERNDENVVIVHDPEFAGFFVEEFDFVWAEARP